MPRTLGDSTIAARPRRRLDRDRPPAGPVPVARDRGGGGANRCPRRRGRSGRGDPAGGRRGVPEAIVSGLGGHRDLGVHSLLVDAMLPLLEQRRHHGGAKPPASGLPRPRRDHGHRAPVPLGARERAGVHGALDRHPRSGGGGGARSLRVRQLGDRDRPDGPGERRGARAAAGLGNRRSVRLRGGGRAGRGAIRHCAAVDRTAGRGLAHRRAARSRHAGHDATPSRRLRRDRVRPRRATRAQRYPARPRADPRSPTLASERGSSATGEPAIRPV